MSLIHKEFGKHYIVELMGCDPQKLKKVEDVRRALLEAARLSEATILGDHFHQFSPDGVTGMIFIAESHFSIHTWPQEGYAAFDIFTCGAMFPDRAIESLRLALGAQRVVSQVLTRGF